MVKYNRNEIVKNVASLSNLSVKYDRKNKQIYIVYTEDCAGTKMGVEVVLRDGYVMPFKYIQNGENVAREYVKETFKDYGEILSLNHVLDCFNIDKYNDYYEFEIDEVKALEIILNEKLKENSEAI